jgi:hypothetical protein
MGKLNCQTKTEPVLMALLVEIAKTSISCSTSSDKYINKKTRNSTDVSGVQHIWLLSYSTYIPVRTVNTKFRRLVQCDSAVYVIFSYYL